MRGLFSFVEVPPPHVCLYSCDHTGFLLVRPCPFTSFASPLLYEFDVNRVKRRGWAVLEVF